METKDDRCPVSYGSGCLEMSNLNGDWLGFFVLGEFTAINLLFVLLDGKIKVQ